MERLKSHREVTHSFPTTIVHVFDMHCSFRSSEKSCKCFFLISCSYKHWIILTIWEKSWKIDETEASKSGAEKSRSAAALRMYNSDYYCYNSRTFYRDQISFDRHKLPGFRQLVWSKFKGRAHILRLRLAY